MNIYVQQSIHIGMIKIGGITNSSVLQIGTSGAIVPASYLFNTGGYTEPAPSALMEEIGEEALNKPVLVPL